MTLRCGGCGHNFYNDSPMSDGRCSWCHEDDKVICYICGRKASCSGYSGYLCDGQHCQTIDLYKTLDEIDRQE